MLGHWEIIALLVVVLLLFGPKNLPKLAKSMGSALRDFKSGVQGVQDEVQDTVKAASTTPPKIDPAEPAASVEAPPAQTAEKSTRESA